MERKEEGKVVGNAEFVRRRRKRRILCCCGSTVALLLLFVSVCVILAVTVFKVRDPMVTVNSVTLKGGVFNFNATQLKLDFGVSLDLNLSIKNPNKASFKFGNGTTQLLYRGTNIGEGNVPADEIGSDGTITMNVTVTVLPDRVLSNGNATSDALAGSFPISSWTRISGRVNFFNIFKHHAVSYTSCDINFAVPSGSLTTPICTYSVKL